MSALSVARARLYEVALPLREPFHISGGELSVRRSLIVAVEDGEGRVGYGEAAPFEAPFYSAETVASARALLRDVLLPLVVGTPLSHASEVHACLGARVRGNRMARAGVETAWWDLQATARGASLADLVSERLRELGVAPEWVARRDYIECGVALGIPADRSLETLRANIEQALERGYRRVKLKIQPGWDVEPARLGRDIIRSRGLDVPITVDANGAYTLADHDALHSLDQLGLLYIEQPFAEEAVWDLRALSTMLGTPVCLDESLTSEDVARQVLDMGGPDVWNIKIQRVGGLEEACRIYARGVQHGVRLWGGTMPETGLGAQAMLALGGHAGFVYASDLEPSERWYEPGTDLVPLEMGGDGTMRVPARRVVPVLARAELVAEW